MATDRKTTASKPAPKAAAPKKAPAKTPASRTRNAAASLPNRVRPLREKARLSPKELAAQIGGDWTASTVRRIERGARKATPEQVARLAEALRVPAGTLFPA